MGKVRVTPKRQLIVKQNATFGTKKPTTIKGKKIRRESNGSQRHAHAPRPVPP